MSSSSQAPTASLPARPVVQRGADADTHALSPTNAMRFLSVGGDGVPDLYEERAGRGDGPPLHQHPWASWELVLEGELRVVAGDDEVTLAAGDGIYLPADVPHAYTVVSERAHVVGMTLSGGRFESLQRHAVPLFAGEGPPDMQAVVALAAEHGVEVLGPPLSAPTP